MSKRAPQDTNRLRNLFLDSPPAYWQASYCRGCRQITESSRTTDHSSASTTLQRKLCDIVVGRSAEPEGIPITALLQLVIEDYRQHDRSDLLEAMQRVTRLLNPYFGHIRANAFHTERVNHYIEFRHNEGKKNATINRELALLRRAFRLGYRQHPQLVFHLPVIKALPENNVRHGFLEADKYHLILNALSDEIKPLFVVASHLGISTGKLLALKRSWIHLEEAFIYVNAPVMNNGSRNTAPIYGEMKPWLEIALSRGTVDSPKCVWLFSRNGKPLKNFKSDWKQACETAGIPGLLFHDLRRTAVRNMIRAGVPEHVALQISGHKTASILSRYNITGERCEECHAGRREEDRKLSRRTESHMRTGEESQ